MRCWLRFALLIPLAALLGCGLSTAPVSPSNPIGNWQIQAGTAITSPPTTYPNFVGALQVQGSQAAAVFSSSNSSTVSPQILSYTGSFDSTAQNVSIIATGWEIQFTEPSVPNTVTTVDVTGGCVGPPTSLPVCTALFLAPSVGVEIAPVTGTYTGTLTDSASPSFNGTGSLTLTQSATPNSSGAFPLTGTVTFPAGSDLGTYPISGTVSGEGIALNYCSTAIVGPCVSLAGSTNPAAAQITVAKLGYSQTGPSYTFTGTLTRQ